jgi:membrane associated rhomboid family serine protease
VFIFPCGFDTLLDRRPWANWIVIAICIAMSLATWSGLVPGYDLALRGWAPTPLLGHSLIHGGFTHLAGNMIVLWVFGNAICSNFGNRFYALAYLACLVASAAVHLSMDGQPAIGASGAINGIVGIALAAYPRNQVNVFWWIFNQTGTFQIRAWTLVLIWLAFDLVGVAVGAGRVAYWAHLGGLGFGVILGLIALLLGWVQTTKWDNATLVDILTGNGNDEQR